MLNHTCTPSQDAQSRLLDKEAELAALRSRVLQLSPRRGAALVASSAAAAAPSGPAFQLRDEPASAAGPGLRGAGTANGTGAGAAGPSASMPGPKPAASRLSPLRPPELSLPAPQVVQHPVCVSADACWVLGGSSLVCQWGMDAMLPTCPMAALLLLSVETTCPMCKHAGAGLARLAGGDGHALTSRPGYPLPSELCKLLGR